MPFLLRAHRKKLLCTRTKEDALFCAAQLLGCSVEDLAERETHAQGPIYLSRRVEGDPILWYLEHPSSVHKAVSIEELAPKRPRASGYKVHPRPSVEEILCQIKETKSLHQTAQNLGISLSLVYILLREARQQGFIIPLHQRKRDPRQRIPSASAVTQKYQELGNRRKTAEFFGVSTARISQVLNQNGIFADASPPAQQDPGQPSWLKQRIGLHRQIFERYQVLRSRSEVARELRITSLRVRQALYWAQKQGFAIPDEKLTPYQEEQQKIQERRRKRLERQEQIVQLYQQGLTQSEVGKRLGVAQTWVSTVLRRRHLVRTGPPVSEENIKSHYNHSGSYSETARAFGISDYHVRQIVTNRKKKTHDL